MTPAFSRDAGLRALRAGFESYCTLTDRTWGDLTEISVVDELAKGELFSRAGSVPTTFGFVCSGLLRAYAVDVEGREYNKVFFPEGAFPGSMVALLTGTPTAIAIDALERSVVMRIDFRRYRQILERRDDLKWFQILYLERNWLLAKEPREVALVQETATERYLRFRRRHPDLDRRLPQYHIASHLGITPTQLSRIRRDLRGDDEFDASST